jgi:hypothetical protein
LNSSGNVKAIYQLKASGYKGFLTNADRAIIRMKTVEKAAEKRIHIWVHNGTKGDILKDLNDVKSKLNGTNISFWIRFANETEYINIMNL